MGCDIICANDAPYNAVGDGTFTPGQGTDNTTALRNFFADLIATGKKGTIGPGVYRITDTVLITMPSGSKPPVLDAPGTNDVAAVRFAWDGPSDRPAFQFLGRAGRFCGEITVYNSTTCQSGFDWEKPTSWTGTALYLGNLSVRGRSTSGGVMQNGIRFCHADPNVSNMEHAILENVLVEDCSLRGLSIESTTMQSKEHLLIDVNIAFCGEYGIFLQSGSFVSEKLAISYCPIAVKTVQLNSEPLVFNGGRHEQNQRFVDASAGSSDNPQPMTFTGVSFDATGMATDGEFMRLTNGGPYDFQNCTFESVSTSFKIVCGTTESGSRLSMTSCVLPHANPFSAGAGRAVVESRGNRCYNGSTADIVNMPDSTLVFDGGTALAHRIEAGLVAASGNEIGLDLDVKVNKAAGNATGLRINVAGAAPGTTTLFDASLAGMSKASIDKDGRLYTVELRAGSIRPNDSAGVVFNTDSAAQSFVYKWNGTQAFTFGYTAAGGGYGTINTLLGGGLGISANTAGAGVLLSSGLYITASARASDGSYPAIMDLRATYARFFRTLQTPTKTPAIYTLDLSQSNSHQLPVLTANQTVTVNNVPDGAMIAIGVTQDSVGGWGITWPTAVKWGAVASSPDGTAGSTTVWLFRGRGANLEAIARNTGL